jgi:hypothetical protein
LLVRIDVQLRERLYDQLPTQRAKNEAEGPWIDYELAAWKRVPLMEGGMLF